MGERDGRRGGGMEEMEPEGRREKGGDIENEKEIKSERK